MRSTKTLTIRAPIHEIDILAQRAREAGLSPSTYARTILARERVDTGVVMALLHRLVEAQHAEVLMKLGEHQAQLDLTYERIGKLRDALVAVLKKNSESR